MAPRRASARLRTTLLCAEAALVLCLGAAARADPKEDLTLHKPHAPSLPSVPYNKVPPPSLPLPPPPVHKLPPPPLSYDHKVPPYGVPLLTDYKVPLGVPLPPGQKVPPLGVPLSPGYKVPPLGIPLPPGQKVPPLGIPLPLDHKVHHPPPLLPPSPLPSYHLLPHDKLPPKSLPVLPHDKLPPPPFVVLPSKFPLQPACDGFHCPPHKAAPRSPPSPPSPPSTPSPPSPPLPPKPPIPLIPLIPPPFQSCEPPSCHSYTETKHNPDGSFKTAYTAIRKNDEGDGLLEEVVVEEKTLEKESGEEFIVQAVTAKETSVKQKDAKEGHVTKSADLQEVLEEQAKGVEVDSLEAVEASEDKAVKTRAVHTEVHGASFVEQKCHAHCADCGGRGSLRGARLCVCELPPALIRDNRQLISEKRAQARLDKLLLVLVAERALAHPIAPPGDVHTPNRRRHPS